MNTLIFGPSGSGKTYISSKLKKLQYNAIDADTVNGLSSWYSGSGKKVTYPGNADEDFLNNHSFLWDRDFLVEYLKDNEEIYLFGVSGNIYDMLDLFDRVYFIKIDPNTQKERLMHDSRENPMGNTKFQRDNAVAWGEELEEKAKELNIQFIDGSLTPEEMINIIKS